MASVRAPPARSRNPARNPPYACSRIKATPRAVPSAALTPSARCGDWIRWAPGKLRSLSHRESRSLADSDRASRGLWCATGCATAMCGIPLCSRPMRGLFIKNSAELRHFQKFLNRLIGLLNRRTGSTRTVSSNLIPSASTPVFQPFITASFYCPLNHPLLGYPNGGERRRPESGWRRCADDHWMRECTPVSSPSAKSLTASPFWMWRTIAATVEGDCVQRG